MINKAIIIGNLTADPEQRYTQSGASVSNFSVATSEKWKGQDGKVQESTEYHRVVAWGRLAEICGKYLGKGSKVYVEGRLQTRSYDKDGEKRYVTEIVAREMKMLSPKRDGGSEQAGYGGSGEDVPF